MPRKKKTAVTNPRRKAAAGPVPPRAVTLAMYDYHLVEDNGKHGLIGIFDTLGAAQFPARFAFYLFVKITGAPGPHRAKIELRDKTNERQILELPEFPFELPAQKVAYQDLVTQVDLELPGPGVHEWRVYLDGTLAGQYAFQAVPAT